MIFVIFHPLCDDVIWIHSSSRYLYKIIFPLKKMLFHTQGEGTPILWPTWDVLLDRAWFLAFLS